MSVSSFCIGLSLLSRNGVNHKASARRKTAYHVLSHLEGRPITDNNIAREEGGRPYFKQLSTPNSDFNISHSADMVAVSHVRGEGLRTGCDIQIVKERINTLRIADRFFSPAERLYITTQKEQGNNTAFFEIWALKECYIKLNGMSVFDMAKTPSFCKDNKICSADDLLFYLYKLKDKASASVYILAAAVNGIPKEPSILWFSDNNICLTKIRY